MRALSRAELAETYEMPDGVVHVWLIERADGEQRSVRVGVTGSAIAWDDLPSPI